MSKSKVAIVLGSGATVGAGFKVKYENMEWLPPMDHDFFRTPVVQQILKRGSYPALSWYCQETASLEETMSIIDLYAKLCLGGIISQEDAYFKNKGVIETYANGDEGYKLKMNDECCCVRLPAMAGWELRKLISEVYKGINHENPDCSPLKKTINKIKPPTIITFNYDLSLEKVLKGEYEYIIPQASQRRQEVFKLFKLHGSLNWKETQYGVQRETVKESNQDIVKIDYCGRNSWIQPSIIGPTLFKQEITIDFQRDERAKFYKDLWRRCWNDLQEVNSLIFIGFSFPQTDFHVRTLLESVHKIKPFTNIILCTKNDNKAYEAARSLFHEAKLINFGNGLEDMGERIDEVCKLIET